MATTIQVSERLKKRLLRNKKTPRETYEEVIERALDLAEEDDLELSPAFKKKVAAARREFAKGGGITTKELLKELGL